MKEMTLGEKIKYRRKELGLSQEEVAERLSVTRQMLSYYENDSVDMKMSVFLEISAALEVSPEWFFGEPWNKDTKEAVIDSLRGAHIMAMYNTLPRFMQEVAEEQMLALAMFISKLQLSMKK